MSATERDPFAARQERAQEVDLLIAQTQKQLDLIEKDLAAVRHRMDVVVRGPEGSVTARILAGVVSLPPLALAGWALLMMLVGMFGRGW